MSPIGRILSRVEVDPDSGCWVWQGATIKPSKTGTGGHGVMFVGSRTDGSRRQVYVHRVAYEFFIGPITEETVDHVYERGCRSRACVNPDHLEAVSRKENGRRARLTALAGSV